MCTLMKIPRLFLFCVALPTVLSTVYFGLMASDVYLSESKFLIRAPERQPTSALGLVLQGAGFARSTDDAYAVHDYVLSRDALMQLEKSLSIRKMFSNENIDRLSRFGGLDGDHSFESLHRHYQRRVDMQLDTSSSIATLTVRAFSPEDALRINQSLLDMSEALINQLNERGRRDLIGFAESEVRKAEARVQAASLALSAFRKAKAVVDPEKQANAQLLQIGKVQDELLANKTQLLQLQSVTPQNPQIPVLKKRIAALEQAEREQSQGITGTTDSLTQKASDYQRLALENEFASKQLATSLHALERARDDAKRQQLYLERIVQPHKADIATEPRRLRAIGVTILLAFMVWGIASLLISGIREHHD
jgi:capsular polysaccharide transport system permease protein